MIFNHECCIRVPKNTSTVDIFPKTLDLAAGADHTSDVGHCLYRLHGREEEDLLDVCECRRELVINMILEGMWRTGRVGEEHNETIDTDTPSTGGRETVFKAGKNNIYQLTVLSKGVYEKHVRVDEGFINTLSLVITLLLLPDLLLEPQSLFEGVVQLGVGIAEFLAAHETFESFTETGTRSVPLGERGHDLWVTD